ncbi:MAG: endonuclease [Pseudomonadota bacterium]|jgi:putative endonuclease
MARTQQLGEAAERRAAEHLARAGLDLVARNYRCRGGEIDLVMRDGAALVFVEVRYRSRPGFGTAAESVDARKRRRLILAAEHYLQANRVRSPCRFDVVGIDAGGQIEWLRDAFGT